jgi:hypothetical protein
MTVCTKLQQTLWIHDNDECHRFFGARQFSTQQQTVGQIMKMSILCWLHQRVSNK